MPNPVPLSIISNTFTDPAERARAIGIWGNVFGLSLALGPILGGTLIASVGYLQDVRGYSALYLLPMAAIVVCAPSSGRILASRGRGRR